MKLIRIFVMLLSVVLGLQTSATEGDAKRKVLVITGGHGYDEAPFFKMFSDNPEITFMHAAHARTNATVYEREDLWGYRVQPKVTPLISTTHPKSGKPLGWAHTYRKSRVVYLQLGHGPEAFNDGHYRKLLWQGIRWTAKR